MPYDEETKTLIINQNSICVDLDYWVNKVILKFTLNKNYIKKPIYTDKSNFINNSFISLLFNEEFDNDSYIYLYSEVIDKESWNQNYKSRLMLFPNTSGLFKPSNTNTEFDFNIFDLKSDDLSLLDILLSYKNNNTVDISIINFEALTTKLSKLIYFYLDLKLNNNYSNYVFNIESESLGFKNLLEDFYELFLSDLIFKKISDKKIT